MDQILIAIFGGTSILFLAKGHPKGALVGSILGLLAEPFWFYTALLNSQWGILAMVLVYSAMFTHAIFTHRHAFKKQG